MVVGFPPFYHQSKIKIQMLKRLRDRPFYPKDMSPELKVFLQGLLEPDPTSRLGWKNGFSEIEEHPWITSFESQEIGWEAMTSPLNRTLFQNVTPPLLESLQATGEELTCKRLLTRSGTRLPPPTRNRRHPPQQHPAAVPQSIDIFRSR